MALVQFYHYRQYERMTIATAKTEDGTYLVVA
jgi:hypothetical protein